MKIRTVNYTTHFAEINGTEVELEFEPVGDPLVHLSDDKKILVIAYLVQDKSPSNPSKDFDGQGNIYTWNEGVITDDKSEILGAFGLEDGGGVDIEHTFDCVPYAKPVSLGELAAQQFYQKILKDPALLDGYMEFDPGEDPVQWAIENHDELMHELYDTYNGYFCEDVGTIAINLYPEYWERIAGPYVVPMNYASQYETIISPTSFDGDPDNLPNCIWVADALAIQNLGTDGDVKKYAAAVCEEYANWCSGYVYGCVVQTFDKNDGEWEARIDYDACWGFIGNEYAEEALKDEFFDPAVKALRPWVCPNQIDLPFSNLET